MFNYLNIENINLQIQNAPERPEIVVFFASGIKFFLFCVISYLTLLPFSAHNPAANRRVTKSESIIDFLCPQICQNYNTNIIIIVKPLKSFEWPGGSQQKQIEMCVYAS